MVNPPEEGNVSQILVIIPDLLPLELRIPLIIVPMRCSDLCKLQLHEHHH